MSPRGGKRPGAGRPVGPETESVTTTVRTDVAARFDDRARRWAAGRGLSLTRARAAFLRFVVEREAANPHWAHA